VRAHLAPRRGGFSGTHSNPRRTRIADDLHPFSTVEVQVRPAGYAQLGGIRVFPESSSARGSAPGPILVLYCYENRDPTYRPARYFIPPRDPRQPAGWAEVSYIRGFELITGINLTTIPTSDPDYAELDECARKGLFPNEHGVVVESIPQWTVDLEPSDTSSTIHNGDTEDTATTFIPLSN